MYTHIDNYALHCNRIHELTVYKLHYENYMQLHMYLCPAFSVFDYNSIIISCCCFISEDPNDCRSNQNSRVDTPHHRCVPSVDASCCGCPTAREIFTSTTFSSSNSREIFHPRTTGFIPAGEVGEYSTGIPDVAINSAEHKT
jgi:hypothetical protein